ncbi:hypothetical protein PGN35_009875 [Nodosilinea sp. PGN35]|uniref:hypothetical protein n=1 Tax=Nodosilinea sp. PGN35 TaxID=3020489 RepID=UPI0023B34ED0|nr:hypothetical protein [Nodosilinea sp. TSF1-S3]MDF0366662.1 hypothetical protein [Nodosilinea sp. TSF1-S3]
MATRLWNFLTADLCDPQLLAPTGRAADAAEVVLRLTAVLATEAGATPTLVALIKQLDSLLDAINAPLGKLVSGPLSFAPLGPGLLRVYGDITQKQPTRAQVVAVVSQAAYLESLREFVNRHPKVAQWLTAKDGSPQARTITLEVKALGLFELTEQDAYSATLHFSQSALGQAFDGALTVRLAQLGATPEIAQRIVEAVSKNTNRHMGVALAAVGEPSEAWPDLDTPEGR